VKRNGIKWMIITLLLSTAALSAHAAAPSLAGPREDTRFGRFDPPPVLRWTDVADATAYEVQIGLDREFATENGIVPISGTLLDISDYVDEETWDELKIVLFWRVRARTGTGPGEWSETRALTKSRLPELKLGEPGLDEHYGADNGFPEFECYWANDDQVPEEGPDQPAHYVVQLSLTEEGFYFEDAELWNEAMYFSLGQYITPAQWNPLRLEFYFRMYAVDEDGFRGPVTPTGRIVKNYLNTPTALNPWDNMRIPPYGEAPLISWTPVTGAEGYILSFAWDIDFFEVRGAIDLPRWQTEFNFYNYMSYDDWIRIGGAFYWRVCAVDQQGFEGPWSWARLFIKTAPRRILVLGDSIAGGYGSAEWDDYDPNLPYGDQLAGYAMDLNDMLAWKYEPQAHVVEYWIPGGQTHQGLASIEWALTTWAPEIVVYAFGITDIIDSARCAWEGCKTTRNLHDIGWIAYNDYEVYPIVGTILAPNPEGSFSGASEPVREKNTEIRQMVANNEDWLHLVDLYRALYEGGGFSYQFFDSLHPNDSGHQRLANAIYPIVTEYFDNQ